MPTLRTFEGATVEEALAKVRDGLGAGARIVNADRIRSGGIAGFFARERFELQVEVPGDDAPAEDAGEDHATGDAASAPIVRHTSEDDRERRRITSILDLADQVSERERVVVGGDERPAAQPSTEQPAFAAVMRRIAGEAGLLDLAERPSAPASETEPGERPFTPLHVGAPAARPTVTTIPAAPTGDDAVAADAPGDADGEPGLPWEPAIGTALAVVPAAPVAVFGAGFDDDAEHGAPGPEHAAADLDSPSEQGPRAAAGPGAEVPAAALVLTGAERDEEHGGDTELVPAVRIPAALERLGLPGPLLPAAATVDDLVPALLRELRRLPAPPPLPSAPGSITCVAGPRDEALELARTVSEELGLDPDEIVVGARQGGRRRGSGEVLTSAAVAAERATRWRTERSSTVVLLPLEPGSRDTAWVRRIVEALQPEAVWGSVDARRKCEDIGAWCDSLGGVDALAVEHVADTVSPAAILQLGVPVALLDDRWASAALWALLLAERVSSAPAVAA